MARRKMKKVRYDSCGRVLNKGESQRPDGRYMYQWVDKLTQKRMTRYADTLQDLRREEAKIEADARDGIHANAADITVNDIFAQLMSAKKGLKESTIRIYTQNYNLFIKDSIGNRAANSVRRIEVESLYQSIMDVGGEGRSGNTLAGVDTVLNSLFRTAVQNDICRKNPCDGVLTQVLKNSGWRQQKRTAVSERDLARFMAFAESRLHVSGRGSLPAIKVMLLTGCRVSEVLGITLDDIDFSNRTLTINKQVVHLNPVGDRLARTTVTEPKTEAGKRVVPMSDDCVSAIREAIKYMMSRPERAEVDGISGFIFVNRYGDVMEGRMINRYIHSTISAFNAEERQAAERENRRADLLPEFSCHILRHTFAARAVENNLNPKLLQTILGHAEIGTTMDIYAEFREAARNQQFEEIRKIACLV